MTRPADYLAQLRKLSVAERLELVGDLWDSIAEEAPDQAFPITADIGAELDRRIAEADARPEAGRPWEEVRARLLDPKRPRGSDAG